MASLFTDNFGRVTTAAVDQEELIKQLSEALRSNDITETKNAENEDAPGNKMKKFADDLPEKIYNAFAKDIDQALDYIKTISDFDAERRKSKTRDERKEKQREAAFSSLESLVRDLQKALTSSAKPAFSSSNLPMTELANSAKELRGIREATSSLSRLFGHKGSGYVHDIHIEAILNQWHKDWKAVQTKRDPSLKFNDPEFSKAIADELPISTTASFATPQLSQELQDLTRSINTLTTEFDDPHGLLFGTGVTADSALLHGFYAPETSLVGSTLKPETMTKEVVSHTAEAMGVTGATKAGTTGTMDNKSIEAYEYTAEEIHELFKSLEASLRGQSKLGKYAAKQLVQYYRTLLKTNQIRVQDLENIEVTMKFHNDIYGYQEKQLRSIIRQVEAGKNLNENAKALLDLSKKQAQLLTGQSVTFKDFKESLRQFFVFQLAGLVTKGVAGIAATNDGISLSQRLVQGVWGEQVKNTTAIRQSLFETMGLTEATEDLRNQYLDASRSVEAVLASGQDLLTYQKAFNKNLKMGVKDLKVLERLTKSSLNLSYMIGANAEATADSFTRWHQQTGLSTAQMSNFNRQIQMAGRMTGVVGDQLLQAVDAARDLADAMRDAGNLTSDVAGKFVQITASAKKFGTEKSVLPVVKALTSSVELLQNASDETRTFLAQSAAAVGKLQELQTGQILKTPENRGAIVKGMREVLNRFVSQFGTDIDHLEKLTDEQRERLNMMVGNATPFKGGIGEAKRALDTFEEGFMSVGDRIKKLGDQLANKNLTDKQREGLLVEKRDLELNKTLSDLTKVTEAIPNAKDMTDVLSKAGMSSDQLRSNLQSALKSVNEGLVKAGQPQIDTRKVELAMKDPKQYAELIEQINEGQNKASVGQKAATDEVAGAMQLANKYNAEIASNTAQMLQTLNRSLGPGGVLTADAIATALQQTFGQILLSGLGQGLVGGIAGAGITSLLTRTGITGLGGMLAGGFMKLLKVSLPAVVVGILGELMANKIADTDNKWVGGLVDDMSRIKSGGATQEEMKLDAYQKLAKIADPTERLAAAEKYIADQKKIHSDSYAENIQSKGAFGLGLSRIGEFFGASTDTSRQRAIDDETSKNIALAESIVKQTQEQVKMIQPAAESVETGYTGGADFDIPDVETKAMESIQKDFSTTAQGISEMAEVFTKPGSGYVHDIHAEEWLIKISGTLDKMSTGASIKSYALPTVERMIGTVQPGSQKDQDNTTYQQKGRMEELLDMIANRTVTSMFAAMPASMEPTAATSAAEPVPMGEESTQSKIEQQLSAVSSPANVSIANQQLTDIAANTKQTSENTRSTNLILAQILGALNGTGGTNNSGGAIDTSTRDLPSSAPTWPKLMYNYNGGARKRAIQVGL